MARFVSANITIGFPFSSAVLDANIGREGGGGMERSGGGLAPTCSATASRGNA